MLAVGLLFSTGRAWGAASKTMKGIYNSAVTPHIRIGGEACEYD